jgi:putative FmdB family regulatory protein
MPVFDFHCKDCRHLQEKLIRSPNPRITCESCGSVNMERLYTIDYFNIKMGYPLWVDRVDDHQKRQVDKADGSDKNVTLPAYKDIAL